jgi:hypothetical protein
MYVYCDANWIDNIDDHLSTSIFLKLAMELLVEVGKKTLYYCIININ